MKFANMKETRGPMEVFVTWEEGNRVWRNKLDWWQEEQKCASREEWELPFFLEVVHPIHSKYNKGRKQKSSESFNYIHKWSLGFRDQQKYFSRILTAIFPFPDSWSLSHNYKLYFMKKETVTRWLIWIPVSCWPATSYCSWSHKAIKWWTACFMNLALTCVQKFFFYFNFVL